jgi:hypothetical protein
MSNTVLSAVRLLPVGLHARLPGQEFLELSQAARAHTLDKSTAHRTKAEECLAIWIRGPNDHRQKGAPARSNAMDTTDDGNSHNPDTLEDSIRRISDRLAKSKCLKAGNIVFTVPESGTGNYVIACGEALARVVDARAMKTGDMPLIEVIGDAKRIQSILDGQTDARKQFLAGGLRVRGDLRYLSDLALELGLLKEPL